MWYTGTNVTWLKVIFNKALKVAVESQKCAFICMLCSLALYLTCTQLLHLFISVHSFYSSNQTHSLTPISFSLFFAFGYAQWTSIFMDFPVKLLFAAYLILSLAIDGTQADTMVTGTVFCDQCKDGQRSIFDYPVNGEIYIYYPFKFLLNIVCGLNMQIAIVIYKNKTL